MLSAAKNTTCPVIFHDYQPGKHIALAARTKVKPDDKLIEIYKKVIREKNLTESDLKYVALASQKKALVPLCRAVFYQFYQYHELTQACETLLSEIESDSDFFALGLIANHLDKIAKAKIVNNIFNNDSNDIFHNPKQVDCFVRYFILTLDTSMLKDFFSKLTEGLVAHNFWQQMTSSVLLYCLARNFPEYFKEEDVISYLNTIWYDLAHSSGDTLPKQQCDTVTALLELLTPVKKCEFKNNVIEKVDRFGGNFACYTNYMLSCFADIINNDEASDVFQKLLASFSTSPLSEYWRPTFNLMTVIFPKVNNERKQEFVPVFIALLTKYTTGGKDVINLLKNIYPHLDQDAKSQFIKLLKDCILSNKNPLAAMQCLIYFVHDDVEGKIDKDTINCYTDYIRESKNDQYNIVKAVAYFMKNLNQEQKEIVYKHLINEPSSYLTLQYRQPSPIYTFLNLIFKDMPQTKLEQFMKSLISVFNDKFFLSNVFAKPGAEILSVIFKYSDQELSDIIINNMITWLEPEQFKIPTSSKSSSNNKIIREKQEGFAMRFFNNVFIFLSPSHQSKILEQYRSLPSYSKPSLRFGLLVQHQQTQDHAKQMLIAHLNTKKLYYYGLEVAAENWDLVHANITLQQPEKIPPLPDNLMSFCATPNAIEQARASLTQCAIK